MLFWKAGVDFEILIGCNLYDTNGGFWHVGPSNSIWWNIHCNGRIIHNLVYPRSAHRRHHRLHRDRYVSVSLPIHQEPRRPRHSDGWNGHGNADSRIRTSSQADWCRTINIQRTNLPSFVRAYSVSTGHCFRRYWYCVSGHMIFLCSHGASQNPN